MIIGIDPGVSGAAAILHGGELINVVRFIRKTPKEIYAEFHRAVREPTISLSMHLFAEDVHSSRGTSSQSMFTFGRSLGWVDMLCASLNVDPVMVQPVRWQRGLGIASSKQSFTNKKKGHKRKLRDLAEKLYPDWKMTNDQADAILIAEYGRRVSEGTA